MQATRSILTCLATAAAAISMAPAADAVTVTAHTALTSHSCAARASSRARRACAAALRRRVQTHYNHPGVASSIPAPAAPSIVAQPTTTTSAPAPTAPTPVASTAPCDNTDLLPTAADIDEIEVATLCLVNQVRGQHGLPALAIDQRLQRSAEQHNDDMVAQDYFEHDGPAGDTPETRIEATGYVDPSLGYILGENIAWGTLDMSTPAAIVNAWVNSPDHLANILQPVYTDTGMAVAPQAPASVADGQPGAVYTEDFGGIQHG